MIVEGHIDVRLSVKDVDTAVSRLYSMLETAGVEVTGHVLFDEDTGAAIDGLQQILFEDAT